MQDKSSWFPVHASMGFWPTLSKATFTRLCRSTQAAPAAWRYWPQSCAPHLWSATWWPIGGPALPRNNLALSGEVMLALATCLSLSRCCSSIARPMSNCTRISAPCNSRYPPAAPLFIDMNQPAPVQSVLIISYDLVQVPVSANGATSSGPRRR
jgi:hypothetical protein